MGFRFLGFGLRASGLSWVLLLPPSILPHRGTLVRDKWAQLTLIKGELEGGVVGEPMRSGIKVQAGQGQRPLEHKQEPQNLLGK